jgi:hypothetical protein
VWQQIHTICNHEDFERRVREKGIQMLTSTSQSHIHSRVVDGHRFQYKGQQQHLTHNLDFLIELVMHFPVEILLASSLSPSCPNSYKFCLP